MANFVSLFHAVFGCTFGHAWRHDVPQVMAGRLVQLMFCERCGKAKKADSLMQVEHQHDWEYDELEAFSDTKELFQRKRCRDCGKMDIERLKGGYSMTKKGEGKGKDGHNSRQTS